MPLSQATISRTGLPAYPRSLKLDSPVLSTRRLLLRPPHNDDAAEMAEHANNLAVASMLTNMPFPYFAEDALDFISQVATRTGDCVYAVTAAQNGRFMGICGIHHDTARHDLPFIGYWLGQPFWGRGFATEAAQAMLDLYFKVTNHDAIMISCHRGNLASRRVIEKLGAEFHSAGSQYNAACNDMRPVDHFMISRIAWIARAGLGDREPS